MNGTRSRHYTPMEVIAIKDFLERRLHSAEVAGRAVMAMSGGVLRDWGKNTKKYYNLVASISRWLLSTITQTRRTKSAKNKHRGNNKARAAK